MACIRGLFPALKGSRGTKKVSFPGLIQRFLSGKGLLFPEFCV